MPILISDTSKSWPKPPEGVYQAVCCDVVELGLEKVTYQNGPEKMVPKIRLYFQLDEMEPDGKRRYIVAKKFTRSLAEKSSLRTFIQSWAGRLLTKDQLVNFDVEKLIGKNCQLQIVHILGRNGETYAQIQTIMPIRGTQGIAVTDYVRKQDRDKPEPPREEVPF